MNNKTKKETPEGESKQQVNTITVPPGCQRAAKIYHSDLTLDMASHTTKSSCILAVCEKPMAKNEKHRWEVVLHHPTGKNKALKKCSDYDSAQLWLDQLAIEKGLEEAPYV